MYIFLLVFVLFPCAFLLSPVHLWTLLYGLNVLVFPLRRGSCLYDPYYRYSLLGLLERSMRRLDHDVYIVRLSHHASLLILDAILPFSLAGGSSTLILRLSGGSCVSQRMEAATQLEVS